MKKLFNKERIMENTQITRDLLTPKEHAEAAMEATAYLQKKFPEFYPPEGEYFTRNLIRKKQDVTRPVEQFDPEVLNDPELQEIFELLRSAFPDCDASIFGESGSETSSNHPSF